MEHAYLLSTVVTNEGRAEDFLSFMRRVTDAATALGGAGEGFILRDSEDSNRFTVVRRWENEVALQRWFGSTDSRTLWAAADEMLESYEGFTAYRVADIEPTSQPSS